MKKLSYVFALVAVLLTSVMCAVVGYKYRDMLCCIEHGGCSAPASVAFLYAIPFLVGIAVCVVLAVVFYNKKTKVYF